ncbi:MULTISPECIES: AprI/Inh family metalloprotease inhibitor [unclassified Roseitalea]|uniref:AprI/Inh family metalloprotease inhibitor n=1 Tax=unclassified Roseitalea TaxID=2639107 RepID=UPI00273FA1F2|nr:MULTISPECIES: AprI/Inh family metalloprotease inhibitor [unclassified Roseitalea]
MQIGPTQWLNIAAVAGIGAMMVAVSLDHTAGRGSAYGIDDIITGSISGGNGIDNDQFMAIDHLTDRTCIFSLHRAEGYDVHRIEPGLACAELGEAFARARTWQENRRGTVAITDHRGKTLMRLARGDGFAWEVVEPRGVQVSLSAY